MVSLRLFFLSNKYSVVSRVVILNSNDNMLSLQDGLLIISYDIFGLLIVYNSWIKLSAHALDTASVRF